MGFAPEDLTRDAFLDGRLQVWQPRRGYRAATDPVFLAAACSAEAGAAVLDLGCGAGVASLCLGQRLPGLTLCGVERQEAYADLARRNAAENGIALEVVLADLTDLPQEIRQRAFDHVIANPPYFPAGGGTAAADAGREAAQREDTPLPKWVEVARARLRPGGWLTMILAAERLPALLAALSGEGMGSVSVLPLAARPGRAATRVLVRARKGGRAAFRLLAPLLIHEGDRHVADGDDYSAAARAVLRGAGTLDWG